MRIYSNYSTNDANIVLKLAKELGFSPSSFQHYCVMLYADQRGNSFPINSLISQMLNNLNTLKSGDSFIVSALLPDEWVRLNRSEKMTLAKQLAHYVKQNPTMYTKFKVTKGKTTIYKKI